MNAFKTLSAAATVAIATVAVIAAAPTPANASILETLNRLEAQGTSSKSGFNKNFRPDFLQKVEADSSSSENGIYNKNFRA
ncbi:MAG: hypothetical protein AAF268_03480 [Cyanobacteria bacterium P01_A01_bin.3]